MKSTKYSTEITKPNRLKSIPKSEKGKLGFTACSPDTNEEIFPREFTEKS